MTGAERRFFMIMDCLEMTEALLEQPCFRGTLSADQQDFILDRLSAIAGIVDPGTPSLHSDRVGTSAVIH